jgi:hypothetical protein
MTSIRTESTMSSYSIAGEPGQYMGLMPASFLAVFLGGQRRLFTRFAVTFTQQETSICTKREISTEMEGSTILEG